MALTKHDLDFNRQTIRVNKSSDDNTRQIRQPKTKNSTAILPMPSALEAMLRNYLAQHWRPNPSGLLFPSHKGIHPRWRDNCVKYGLHPILKRLMKMSGSTPSDMVLLPNLRNRLSPCQCCNNRCATQMYARHCACMRMRYPQASVRLWSGWAVQLVQLCRLVQNQIPTNCVLNQLAEACGSRTHHPPHEGTDRRL